MGEEGGAMKTTRQSVTVELDVPEGMRLGTPVTVIGGGVAYVTVRVPLEPVAPEPKAGQVWVRSDMRPFLLTRTEQCWWNAVDLGGNYPWAGAQDSAAKAVSGLTYAAETVEEWFAGKGKGAL